MNSSFPIFLSPVQKSRQNSVFKMAAEQDVCQETKQFFFQVHCDFAMTKLYGIELVTFFAVWRIAEC